MKCEEVDRMIIDYLDNNLEEDIRTEIDNHLASCERCIDEMKDTQRVLNLVSDVDMAKPDDSLRINFYHMLHGEMKKVQDSSRVPNHFVTPWYNSGRFRIAASIALLICGTFVGLFIRSGHSTSYSENELRQLQTEVTNLKKATMYTMLKDGSSSERIQAVSYVDDLGAADENVIDVLVKTLNNDKNVNVRMAAAYALSKFAGQRSVSDSLVNSLEQQTDPILQVTLINILAERKEKSALKPIQKIIANKSTLKEVRTVAENSLRVLI